MAVPRKQTCRSPREPNLHLAFPTLRSYNPFSSFSPSESSPLVVKKLHYLDSETLASKPRNGGKLGLPTSLSPFSPKRDLLCLTPLDDLQCDCDCTFDPREANVIVNSSLVVKLSVSLDVAKINSPFNNGNELLDHPPHTIFRAVLDINCDRRNRFQATSLNHAGNLHLP